MILLYTDVAHTPGIGKYAGTYKIATELRLAGYDTQVIDNLRWMGLKRLKQTLDKFLTKETLFIGVSNTLLTNAREKGEWGITNEDFKSFIRYAKKINPNVKIVAGGAGITRLSDWSYVDYAILNKGDNAIVALADYLKNGGDLKYTQNPINTRLIDGDDYFYTQEEFSRSKIIFEHKDIVLSGEALPIEIARGCIFKCAYCYFDLIGKKVGDWTKTEETLYEELMYNYKIFGTTQYMVSDELVNESLEKLEMIVRVAERLPFKFEYTAYARIDLIHRYPEMIQLLKRSGAIGLAFGIETFNHQAGKAVGKGMDPNRVKELLYMCKKEWQDDIIISGNFIMGLPGESLASFMQTVDWLMEPDCPIDIFELNLLNMKATSGGKLGNKMGDDPEKYGYIVDRKNKTWSNKEMSKEEANALMWQLKKSPEMQQKRKFMSATYIGRILSLGYTVSDIFDMNRNMSWSNALTQVRLRSNIKKQEYFERLMKL